MRMELINNKQELLALEGMLKSEGFAVYSRIITSQMKTSYDKMMKEDLSADAIKQIRDKMIGLKEALEVSTSVLNSYKGKFDE